jgi:deoxyribodipyrimidine photolyase
LAALAAHLRKPDSRLVIRRGPTHPEPIVSHADAREAALKAFARIKDAVS